MNVAQSRKKVWYFWLLRENRVLETTFPAISHFADQGFREKAELPEPITDCFTGPSTTEPKGSFVGGLYVL